MSSRAWLLSAVLAAAMAALLVVVARQEADAATDAEPPVGPSVAVPGVAAEAHPAPPDSARAAVEESSGTVPFMIEVVDAEDRPAAGQIAILESREPPLFSSGADFVTSAFDDRIRIVEHDGCIQFARERGTWLSVAARGSAGIARGLLPPDDSLASVRIQVSTVARCASVMVVDADLETLVRDGELRVLRWIDEGEIRESVIAIDSTGVTRVDFEEARSLKIFAPGATNSDEEPHTAVVHAPALSSAHCPFVTVARTGPRVDVSLEIEITGDVERHGVLALRRIDDGSLRELPWREPLRSGRQIARFRIDPGDYELVTWPLGRLEVAAGGDLVRARPPAFSGRFLLRERTARVRLRLEGIDRFKLPVHVQWQSGDGILSSRPGSAHLGPWTWRDLEQEVSVVEKPGWLVAQGPNGAWISTASWEGAPVVDMRPGTFLSVAWQPESPGVERAWLEVESPLGGSVVPLRREVAAFGFARGPGFHGSCYLPREPFEIACIAERGGEARAIWKRRVEPRSYRCPIEVR